jgi:hypothetical protein
VIDLDSYALTAIEIRENEFEAGGMVFIQERDPVSGSDTGLGEDSGHPAGAVEQFGAQVNFCSRKRSAIAVGCRRPF